MALINPALESLPGSAFIRLRQLLDHLPTPQGKPTLAMSIGEPQLPPPHMVAEILQKHANLWNKYPPNDGTLAFRTACTNWLTRRFDLPMATLDPEKHVVSAAGSREALYLFTQTITPDSKNGQKPVVLMPNPYYQVYRAAAAFAGAETVLVPASAETGYLPDLTAVDTEILARTAMAIVCTPSNPEGAVADLDRLKGMVELARKYDFILASDECYADLYFGDKPSSALNAALEVPSPNDDPLSHVVVFHSLSKRSSVPGLRSGFTAGDVQAITHFKKLRAYACVAMPMPVQEAAIALWDDETHAADNRAHYARLVAAADDIFADYDGYIRPAGGFFLWLNVGDGEAAAVKLWQEAGIRVIPGRYLTADDPMAPNGNLGHAFIRIALVHDEATVISALKTIYETLKA